MRGQGRQCVSSERLFVEHQCIESSGQKGPIEGMWTDTQVPAVPTVKCAKALRSSAVPSSMNPVVSHAWPADLFSYAVSLDI